MSASGPMEIYAELRQMREHLETIEHTTEILVRANGERILSDIWARMDRDPVLARIYLLLDGRRSQQEIASLLQEDGSGAASQMTVSRRIDMLYKDMGIIELVDHTKAGKIYRRSRLDNILGIRRQLTRRMAQRGAGT